jgi:uncharacterized protein YbaR (Trm112 family)
MDAVDGVPQDCGYCHSGEIQKYKEKVMHEIICPHCKKAFKIDEAGYADILKQVRDSEFDQQLHERLELAEKIGRASCRERVS